MSLADGVFVLEEASVPEQFRQPRIRELVTYIAQSLVDKPEEVRVVQVERGYLLTLELSVDPDEMGKVIGRQGRIAKALRTLVTAAATKEGKRASLEIV